MVDFSVFICFLVKPVKSKLKSLIQKKSPGVETTGLLVFGMISVR